MSSQPAFCAYCGAPLPPGSVFCGSCGQRVAVVPAPPQGPVAYSPPSPPPPAPPTTAAPATPRRRSAARATAKKRGPSVGSALLLTLVGLMLILFGLRGPILQVAGATAIGAVTSVTQDTSDEDSSGYAYDISYSFRTPDGQQRNGMTTRSNVLNTASLPAKGSRVTVRYLPAAPFINAPAGEATFSLGTIALLAIGALVIYLGWRPR